jgi:hypothetical protein
LLLQVFFNGGILSNDASTPVNGSAFEVLDLRTLSPYVIQVRIAAEDQSHHLVQRGTRAPEARSCATHQHAEFIIAGAPLCVRMCCCQPKPVELLLAAAPVSRGRTPSMLHLMLRCRLRTTQI